MSLQKKNNHEKCYFNQYTFLILSEREDIIFSDKIKTMTVL